MRAPWGWHDSVETCTRAVIYKFIVNVHLLVNLKKNKVWPSSETNTRYFRIINCLLYLWIYLGFSSLIVVQSIKDSQSRCSASNIIIWTLEVTVRWIWRLQSFEIWLHIMCLTLIKQHFWTTGAPPPLPAQYFSTTK